MFSDIELFGERLLKKMHVTISKGIVDGLCSLLFKEI